MSHEQGIRLFICDWAVIFLFTLITMTCEADLTSSSYQQKVTACSVATASAARRLQTDNSIVFPLL